MRASVNTLRTGNPAGARGDLAPIAARPRRRVRSHHLRLAVGGLVFLALVGGSILAPALAPADPMDQELNARLKAPSWRPGRYVLGADQLGRDLFSRVLYGGRVTLIVALSAVGVAGVVGVTSGLLSGYFEGHLDTMIMSVADIQLALPFVLLSIVVIATLGVGLWKVILVLILSGWVVFARLVRGVVLSLKQMEFVLASRSIGASDTRILVRHVLPNALTPVLAIMAPEIARMILAESALSFLGLSGQASVPTWGGILSDSRDYVHQAPWMLVFPGVAIMVTVISINLVGEWLRQVLNPRLTTH